MEMTERDVGLAAKGRFAYDIMVSSEVATSTGGSRSRRSVDLAEPPQATIYLPEEGGPLRTLFGLGHKHLFAINRDPKTNEPNPTEGVTERALAMRLATDPDVPFYQAQPCRIELMVGSILRSWIPDCWVVRRDGTMEMVEIKIDMESLLRDRREGGGADYVAKLEACFDLLNGMGIGARVRYASDVLGPVDRQVNVATLYPDRSAEIHPWHREAFETLLADGAELAFGDLVAEIDPDFPMQSQAVCHRLICAGRVWADLDELVTDDTPVTLRGPAPTFRSLRAVLA